MAAVFESTVVIRDGLISTEDSKSAVTFYNESGRVVQQLFAGINGKERTVYKYEYGTCEEYQKWTWTTERNSRTDTVQRQRVYFDKDCRINKVVWMDSVGKPKEVRTLLYDSSGRQVSEYDTDAKNVVTTRVLYTYPDSLTTDKKAYFQDNTFWYHAAETRDKKGNLLTSISFDEKGSPQEVEKTEYTYDKGQLTQTTRRTNYGTTTTTYTYDADNLLAESISRSVGRGEDTETISVFRYKKRTY